MKIRPGHLVKYVGNVWMVSRDEGVVVEVTDEETALVKWDTGFMRMGLIPVAELQVTADLLEQQWAGETVEPGDVPG